MFPDKYIFPDFAISVGDSVEADGVKRFFSGHKIGDVTLESFDSYPHDPAACLGFMTPQAYVFFLPAFMRMALEECESGNPIPDAVVWQLLVIAKGEYPDRREAIELSYSEAQLKGVKEFLKEMSVKYEQYDQDDAAKQALSLYWNNF